MISSRVYFSLYRLFVFIFQTEYGIRYIGVTGVQTCALPISSAQNRVKNQVLDAIQHARKGSYIKIALFSFDRRDMGEALIKAYRRGVHVQVLLNEHQVTDRKSVVQGKSVDLGGRRIIKTNFF